MNKGTNVLFIFIVKPNHTQIEKKLFFENCIGFEGPLGTFGRIGYVSDI